MTAEAVTALCGYNERLLLYLNRLQMNKNVNMFQKENWTRKSGNSCFVTT